jgi:hypothetical protein
VDVRTEQLARLVGLEDVGRVELDDLRGSRVDVPDVLADQPAAIVVALEHELA